MSLRKSPKLSSEFTSANRRNAQKSTGPRTTAGKRRASQNSYRHGLYATPGAQLRKNMAQLDQDPEQLASIEENLTQAWAPDNAMQAMIVSDLARLYWKKSQLAKVLIDIRMEEKKVEGARITAFTAEFQAGTEPIDEPMLAEMGYRGIEMSKRVFDEGNRLLRVLWVRAKACDWNGDLSAIFTSLYGTNPNPKGTRIISLFKQFAHHHGETPADADRPEYAELLTLVAEEKASFTNEYELYWENKVAEFAETTGSDWMPASVNWGKALDQDSKLSRQIETQSGLLIRLKRLRKPSVDHDEPI